MESRYGQIYAAILIFSKKSKIWINYNVDFHQHSKSNIQHIDTKVNNQKVYSKSCSMLHWGVFQLKLLLLKRAFFFLQGYFMPCICEKSSLYNVYVATTQTLLMGNEEYFTISFYFMGKNMVPTDVKRIWDIWMTGDCKHQLTWVKKIKSLF